MWLDRLSGHSTPTPTPTPSAPSSSKRSYSPGARRSSNLAPLIPSQRPGFSPRSSSLSVLSNDSTTSLLSLRRPNGSGLKHSATNTEIPGPLEVLGEIVGPEVSSESVELVENDGEYGDYELNLDFTGLNLHEIATGVPSAGQKEISYAAQSVEECMHSFALLADVC